MTCIYKPDEATKKLMKQYADILGSEEAAYYVLTQNNGYPLDKTPLGEDSQLYFDILQNSGQDTQQAIRKKAMLYTQPFLQKYGDWTMGQAADPNMLDQNGEPLLSSIDPESDINKLMNNLYLKDDPNQSRITTYDDLFNVKPDDKLSKYAIEQLLKLSCQDYVNNALRQARLDNVNITNEELEIVRVTKTREWQHHKALSILTEESKTLASAFGLRFKTNTNGSIELTSMRNNDDQATTDLRIKFVQNLTQDPLEDQWGILTENKKLKHKFQELPVGSEQYVNTAVSQNRTIDHAFATSTLIYLSLNQSSAVTLSKTLAHHYIVQMLDSPLIQEALRTFDDQKNPRSTLYLINKLVDAITDPRIGGLESSSLLNKALNNKKLTEDEQEKLKFFSDFWEQFDDLSKKIIKDGVTSKKHQLKLLSVVSAAIALNEQVEVFNAQTTSNSNYSLSSEESLANWYAVKYSPLYQAQRVRTEGEQMFESLKTAYENKIKRFKRKNDDQNYGLLIIKLLTTLENVKQSDPDNIEDQIKVVEDLLTLADMEISEAIQSLAQIEDNVADIYKKAAFISTIYDETVSFYSHILNKQLGYVHIDPNFSQIKLQLSRINDKNMHLRQLYNSKLYDITCGVFDKYVDDNISGEELTISQKNNLKANAHLWLKNQSMYGDLSSFETVLMMASLSRSEIVKMVSNALSSVNARVDSQTQEVAQDLGSELGKATARLSTHGIGQLVGLITPGSFQHLFQERDPNTGKPTGMFTRRRNYGVFYAMRKAESAKLIRHIEYEIQNKTGNTHFRFEVDNNGNPIFPEDSEYDEYWREYQHKINAFECKYANKRYKQEYYDLRIDTLSRTTIKMQDDIQNKIDAIQVPITEKGVPHIERLDLETLQDLWDLWNQQEQLANRYDASGHLKEGDELKAAEEIKNFRKLIQDRRKSTKIR